MSEKDEVIPKDKWVFDKQVTSSFDNMLERSIPQYNIMRKACHDLAVEYAQQGSAIVDLGCSRGGAIASLIKSLGNKNKFIGIEVSRPMVEALHDRFKQEIIDGHVTIELYDLKNGLPETLDASVILSVLTMQFIPIEYRHAIIKNIYNALKPNGAFIFVEKLLGNTDQINKSMVKIYYSLKYDKGYTQDQIKRKKLSLEGVLVPITARWNEDLLRQTGFKQIDCFWRWMNFAGWIAIK